jgi:hypothetical protein
MIFGAHLQVRDACRLTLEQLLRDVAAVTAMLDRLLHHGHILKCGEFITLASLDSARSNRPPL